MTDTSRMRRRLLRLFEEDPSCWWCGMPLALHMERRMAGRTRDTPADFATIDHLNDRSRYPDGRPLLHLPGERAYALSCPDCNEERGRWSELLHAATRELADERDLERLRRWSQRQERV
jgi:hypothetical protein